MPKLSLSSARRAPSTTGALLFTLLAACGVPNPASDDPSRTPNRIDRAEPSPTVPSRTTLDRAALRDAIAPESEGLLPRLGIASTASDALSPEEQNAALDVAGTLTAVFDAPVAAPDGTVAELGTAQVTLDDVDIDLASGVLLDASAEGVSYAVLFDPQAPSTWVVVAAQTSALAPGATLSLDGLAAAAVVLDELTGEARLALGGALLVSDAELVEGGSLSASLTSELVAVDLDTWPVDLFPLADDLPDDHPATTSSTAAGTFSVVFLDDQGVGDDPGMVAIEAQAQGFEPLLPTAGYAYAQGDGSHTLAFVDDNGRMIAVVVPAGALSAPGTIVLDGETSAAWWVEADGSAWFYSGGTLTLDSGAAGPGDTVSGSIALEGDLTYGANLYGDDDDPYEPSTGSCDELATLASSFEPATGAVVTAADVGGPLPEGFDRLVILEASDRASAFQALIPAGADLELGVAVGEVDIDGFTSPQAAFFSHGCETDAVFVTNGTLSAASDGTGWQVELNTVIDDEAIVRSWSVAGW